jgi:hypothetical protein
MKRRSPAEDAEPQRQHVFEGEGGQTGRLFTCGAPAVTGPAGVASEPRGLGAPVLGGACPARA